MIRRSKHIHTEEACVEDAVSMAISDLEELASECREVVDNASEGLQQTQRIQTLDETASILEGISAPDVPESAAEIRCTWTVNRHPRASRAQRRDNATDALAAAVQAIDARIEELEQEIEDHEPGNPAIEQKQEIIDELSMLRDEIESIQSEAESAEFPGMYG